MSQRTNSVTLRFDSRNVILLLFVITALMSVVFLGMATSNMEEMVSVEQSEDMWEQTRVFAASSNNNFTIGITLLGVCIVLYAIYNWMGQNNSNVQINNQPQQNSSIYAYVEKQKENDKSRKDTYEDCVSIFQNNPEVADNIDTQCTKEINKFTWKEQ